MHYLLLILLSVCIESQEVRDARKTMTPAGYEFRPKYSSIQSLGTRSVSSTIRCARACLLTLGCRTFDYDKSGAGRCRLYEADQTNGQNVASSATSIVGSVSITQQQFSSFNRTPCSTYCTNHLYLSCNTNNTCQCAARTYWDGSVCQLQKFTGASCTKNEQCRGDLGYVCLQFFQCGRE